MAIAKKAGLKPDYVAACPDMVKIKFNQEELNHWYDSEQSEALTIETIREQIEKYDCPDLPKGHLLGAIVASVRDCIASQKKRNKVNFYFRGFTAHYIGDLSQPFHMSDYDDFNKKSHTDTDGIVEQEVSGNLDKIKLYDIVIRNEDDLMREILKIAKISKALGYKLRKEDRMITLKEAYIQLGHSASLLKAVIAYCDRMKN